MTETRCPAGDEQIAEPQWTKAAERNPVRAIRRGYVVSSLAMHVQSMVRDWHPDKGVFPFYPPTHFAVLSCSEAFRDELHLLAFHLVYSEVYRLRYVHSTYSRLVPSILALIRRTYHEGFGNLENFVMHKKAIIPINRYT